MSGMLNKNVNKHIKNILRNIVSKYQPEKVILFGSCVSGDVTSDSDIDMLIIKNTAKNIRERWKDVCIITRDLNRRIPFEPIILTEEEAQMGFDGGNFFLKKVFEEGVVLYEKTKKAAI